MRVLRTVIHAPTRQPVLLLGEVDGDRCVPVFLRRPQADVISLGPRSRAEPALTQDMLLPVLRSLGHRVDGVEISALVDGVFHAALLVDGGTRVEVRPSDALALAVRDELPITMADSVLDSVGQPTAELFPHGGDAPPEQQLREFHDFVEDLSPDDFQNPPGGTTG